MLLSTSNAPSVSRSQEGLAGSVEIPGEHETLTRWGSAKYQAPEAQEDIDKRLRYKRSQF